ncbi:MAG: biotin transporter BioY [Clostridiales bacterium]|nr:biotin transporter BioY [Clostridiales bacterium]
MKLRNLILTALFAALTAIGAFIRIPFAFSSITLQFFFTAMAGVLLGARWGAASQAVYVLLGLVGLPIFTQGGGFSYVLQPTFGFLVGLIPAAWLIGYMSRKKSGFWWLCLGCLAGLGVLYLIGMPYMAVILNVYLAKGMSLWSLLMAGMLPFLPGDMVKIAVTALLCGRLRPVLSRYLPQ